MTIHPAYEALKELERANALLNKAENLAAELSRENAKLREDLDRYKAWVAEIFRRLNLPEGDMGALENLANNISILKKQRDDLLVKIAEAEDEASALRAAIYRTLQENKHLADGENCTLWRLERAVGLKANASGDLLAPGASEAAK